MDLHVPEGPVRSLKDFLLHILIVTIGILIAIGLEQLVEAHHRHRLAEEAVAGFRRELAENRRQMDQEVAATAKLRGEIEDTIANLESAAPQKIHYPGFEYNVMASASWDTAVATQALAELPYDQVRRFAEAYGAYRVFDEIERRSLATWQETRLYGEDPSRLGAEQRRALIEKLRLYENATYVIDNIGRGVARTSDDALQQK